MLLDVEKDLKNNCLEELQLLGYYNKKEDKIDENIEGLIEGVKELEEEEHRKYIQQELFTQDELNFMKEYGEISFAQKYNRCPICGDKLLHVGNCANCNSCSWSKCE